MLVKRDYKLPNVKPDTVYGFIRVKGKEKPIFTCREILKGKNKGKFECTYLSKPKKYVTVTLSKNEIRLLNTPWKKKQKTKLVKRTK